MSAKYTFLAWDTPIDNAPLKLSLLQLANNSDDNGFSYYSISKMAKACGMSERTFMRKIAELEKMGILVVERRPNRSSLYKLIGDEMGVTLCHLQKSGVTESHLGVTESHSDGDRESHDPNSNPNTTTKSNNIDHSAQVPFNSFWAEWPNKKGRKQAEAKFESVFKRLCKEHGLKATLENKTAWSQKLIKDVQKRIETKQFGFEKLHATTYLNNERWNDDYETNQSGNDATGNRKLTAEEERNQELLAKYGHSSARTERTINPDEHTGLDQHQVQRSVPEQMEQERTAIDLDSGDWSSHG